MTSTTSTPTNAVPEFGFESEAPRHTAAYLRGPIESLLPPFVPGARVLDIGCGNGYWIGQFLEKGYDAVGADPSDNGMAIARRVFPKGRFYHTIVTENFLKEINEAPFDVVLSTEVVEHVYAPRLWARAAFSCLKPGGRLICSTPYHGYFKNLVLAVLNKYDRHWDPLWDGGHIKFWSCRTLTKLLQEAGFENVQFRGAGRAPYLWMSMVLSADKPR